MSASRKRRSVFRRRLDERNGGSRNRRWLFVSYDQLNDRIGPLAKHDPCEIGIVLIENRWKARRRPYHQQKLALLIANLRHFALEQASRGVAVRHLAGDAPYREILAAEIQELGPIEVMRPAEYELRVDLAPLIASGGLREIPHDGWLTTPEQFAKSQKSAQWRMDAFYRFVRRDTGILMSHGQPVGGKFSFDPANRLPWKGKPPAAIPPHFHPDEITEEVVDRIERDFSAHPGRVEPAMLPATLADARHLWSWAQRECLPNFGPFEDAMSQHSRTIFHSRISALLNLHRLLPTDVVSDVLQLKIPIASKEGFIRQILGWREFMHHVHHATNGFRIVAGRPVPVAQSPGDGGFSRWARQASAERLHPKSEFDGGALPNFLGAANQLPLAFWGTPSGLACLDTVVREVWEDAYGHHITRLMVLSNIATLLDVSPRELADWFWVAYADAYDWVVEPNVLGMGTYSLGDLFTTKPYVSGAAYIDRMSDYCRGCSFDPRKTCPLTRLYWAFLERHKDLLGGNARLSLPYRNLKNRSADQKRNDSQVFTDVLKKLGSGAPLVPDPANQGTLL